MIFGFIPDDVRYCQMWGWVKPYFDFKDGQLTLEKFRYYRPRRKAAF